MQLQEEPGGSDRRINLSDVEVWRACVRLSRVAVRSARVCFVAKLSVARSLFAVSSIAVLGWKRALKY